MRTKTAWVATQDKEVRGTWETYLFPLSRGVINQWGITREPGARVVSPSAPANSVFATRREAKEYAEKRAPKNATNRPGAPLKVRCYVSDDVVITEVL